jgi:glycosyltransferase involved in cell wall biosynthesis
MAATGTPTHDRRLRDVLVLTVRKSFWSSPESEIFPNRVFVPTVVGHSTSLVNTALLAARAAIALLGRRPRLVFFGSAHRLVPLFLLLRRARLLRRTKLIVTNQVYFGPRLGRYADRVIVYSRREAELGPTYVYLPIPADGDFDAVVAPASPSPYVFSGGGTLRDYASLFAAVDGTGVPLTVVTHSRETLGDTGPLPAECRILWRMPLQEFLSLMAGSLFVVVPLKGMDTPHGHTTIAQALCLGKAVVTTRGSAVADYVHDGVEGLLVDPGDVDGYRSAIQRLHSDERLRRACEEAARKRRAEFSYASFARSIADLCADVLAEPS